MSFVNATCMSIMVVDFIVYARPRIVADLGLGHTCCCESFMLTSMDAIAWSIEVEVLFDLFLSNALVVSHPDVLKKP